VEIRIGASVGSIRRQRHLVSSLERTAQQGHTGGIFWLTGLSGSGKSSIAMAVEQRLCAAGMFVYVLDGDNIRCGLNRDLRFSPADRTENIRRVAEVAALFADAGAIALTALISPNATDRAAARAVAAGDFHEIYIKADLQTCEARDPKGLYARARRREIPQFTGVSAPYDVPVQPDLVLETSIDSLDTCVERFVAYVRSVTSIPIPHVAAFG